MEHIFISQNTHTTYAHIPNFAIRIYINNEFQNWLTISLWKKTERERKGEKEEEWRWECMKESESKKNEWMNESLRIYMAILPHIVGTIILQLCCNLVCSFF